MQCGKSALALQVHNRVAGESLCTLLVALLMNCRVADRLEHR